MFHVTVLTLSFIGGFWTDISKCSDGGTTKLIFFKRGIGNQKVCKVKNFQVWVPQDILSERQKNKGGSYSANQMSMSHKPSKQ